MLQCNMEKVEQRNLKPSETTELSVLIFHMKTEVHKVSPELNLVSCGSDMPKDTETQNHPCKMPSPLNWLLEE